MSQARINFAIDAFPRFACLSIGEFEVYYSRDPHHPGWHGIVWSQSVEPRMLGLKDESAKEIAEEFFSKFFPARQPIAEAA